MTFEFDPYRDASHSKGAIARPFPKQNQHNFTAGDSYHVMTY